MALDVSLLYGEMVASAILHIAIVFAIFMLISSLQIEAGLVRLLIFLGACVFLSWGVQAVLLAILQASSKGGVKSFSSVAVGATIAAAITAGMIAIPMFIEPARLVVSSLFILHHTLGSPQEIAQAAAVVEAATSLAQKGGGSLDPEAFDQQSLKEIAFGAGFWGAFAGAYGIGVGSLF
jgi:hypothetical protein